MSSNNDGANEHDDVAHSTMQPRVTPSRMGERLAENNGCDRTPGQPTQVTSLNINIICHVISILGVQTSFWVFRDYLLKSSNMTNHVYVDT